MGTRQRYELTQIESGEQSMDEPSRRDFVQGLLAAAGWHATTGTATAVRRPAVPDTVVTTTEQLERTFTNLSPGENV